MTKGRVWLASSSVIAFVLLRIKTITRNDGHAGYYNDAFRNILIMDNKHLEAIPSDVVLQIQAKLNEIKTLLTPFAESKRNSMLRNFNIQY